MFSFSQSIAKMKKIHCSLLALKSDKNLRICQKLKINQNRSFLTPKLFFAQICVCQKSSQKQTFDSNLLPVINFLGFWVHGQKFRGMFIIHGFFYQMKFFKWNFSHVDFFSRLDFHLNYLWLCFFVKFIRFH